MVDKRVTPKRFGLASSEWTGLAKVGEEAGEVVQEIMKIVATGGKLQYANGTKLDLEKLFGELGDLQASVDFFLSLTPNAKMLDVFNEHRSQKFEKYTRWNETEKR